MTEFVTPNDNGNVIDASDRFARRGGRTLNGMPVPSNFAEIEAVNLPSGLESLTPEQIDALTQLNAGLSSSDEKTRDSYMAAVSQANTEGKLPDIIFTLCAAVHYSTDVSQEVRPPQA